MTEDDATIKYVDFSSTRARSDVDYSKVPVPHMKDAVRRYIESRIPPGHFLTAIITNDLRGAVQYGDQENLKNLAEWARFFYNEVPAIAWGDHDTFMEYINDVEK
jgi:hypothetical protein